MFFCPIRRQNGGDYLELVWQDIVPRGSSSRSLLFFVPYFPARLDFPSPPLSAPRSPRMPLAMPNNRKQRDKPPTSQDRPFAASHSRGTKPPCWRAKVELGQDKQGKLPFKIMYVFCLSCPSANFALQRGGFVPRKWLAAKGLLCAKFSMCKFRRPSLLYPYPKFRPLKLRRLLY